MVVIPKLHQEHEHLKQLKRRHAELVKETSRGLGASRAMSKLRISNQLCEKDDDGSNPAECNNYSSLIDVV